MCGNRSIRTTYIMCTGQPDTSGCRQPIGGGALHRWRCDGAFECARDGTCIAMGAAAAHALDSRVPAPFRISISRRYVSG